MQRNTTGAVWWDNATNQIKSWNGSAVVVLATDSFTDLLDTPANFSGAASKVVSVNSGATALEYTTPATVITAFTGLTDTPANFSGAASKVVSVNSGATALEYTSLPTEFPVGGIIPWLSPLAGSPMPTAPTNWQLCDGSAISGGPLDGKNTPNLNSGKYLRGHNSSTAFDPTSFVSGGSTSSSSAGSHTHTPSLSAASVSHTHTTGYEVPISPGPSALANNQGVGPDRHYHSVNAAVHSHSVTGSISTGGSHSHAGNEPPFIDLLYIIKIA